MSSLAAQIDGAIEGNEKVAGVLTALLEMAEEARAPIVPHDIETQDISKYGQEIIRIAFANEGNPAKVMREVLKLLRK